MNPFTLFILKIYCLFRRFILLLRTVLQRLLAYLDLVLETVFLLLQTKEAISMNCNSKTTCKNRGDE